MSNFVFEYNEDRKVSGVGGAVYFKTPSESKYAFAFATGTIPSAVGDVNTYDAFVITEKYAGKVAGQQTLEKMDLPVMWHRDMKARLIELSEMGELDFLIIAPDYTADQITGTLSYKRGDLGDSTFEGIASITPNSMSPDKILNARSLIKGTAKFAKNGIATIIPDSIKLEYGDSSYEVALPLDATITPTTRVLDGMGNVVDTPKLTATVGSEKITLVGSNNGGTEPLYYLVEIKISESGKQDWKATIAVEVPISATPGD